MAARTTSDQRRINVRARTCAIRGGPMAFPQVRQSSPMTGATAPEREAAILRTYADCAMRLTPSYGNGANIIGSVLLPSSAHLRVRR